MFSALSWRLLLASLRFGSWETWVIVETHTGASALLQHFGSSAPQTSCWCCGVTQEDFPEQLICGKDSVGVSSVHHLMGVHSLQTGETFLPASPAPFPFSEGHPVVSCQTSEDSGALGRCLNHRLGLTWAFHPSTFCWGTPPTHTPKNKSGLFQNREAHLQFLCKRNTREFQMDLG